MIDSASAVETLVLVFRSTSSLRLLMPTLELRGELFNRFGCLVLARRRGRGVECCLELSTKFRDSFYNVQGFSLIPDRYPNVRWTHSAVLILMSLT